MLMIREFALNNYRIVGFIGLKNSPTCGVHWGKHKVNRYNTESPNPADDPSPDDPVLKGIMVDILSEELAKSGIEVPFLEFPGQAAVDSDERKKFWDDLKKIVEPYSQNEAAEIPQEQ